MGNKKNAKKAFYFLKILYSNVFNVFDSFVCIHLIKNTVKTVVL